MSDDVTGVKRKDGVRPIRIVMESKGKKAELMSNLWKLKYAANAFKKSESPTTTHGKNDKKSHIKTTNTDEERMNG